MTTEIAVRQHKHMRSFLAELRPVFQRVIDKHLTPDQLDEIVVAEMVRNPKLYQCLVENPDSLVTVVQHAAKLGLDPSGPLGHYYLIPRKIDGLMTLTHIVGAKGYQELARRAQVSIRAGTVYQDELVDLFHWSHEPPGCEHRWAPGVDRSDEQLCAAYAIADGVGFRHQLLMERAEIEKRRAIAQTDKFWRNWYPEMCRKTVIRRLLASGDVPLSEPLKLALEHDVEHVDVTEPAPEPLPPPADPLRKALGMSAYPPSPDELPLIEQVQYWEAQCRDFGEAADAAGMNLDAAAEDQDPEVLERYLDELKVRSSIHRAP